jgi:hypothetical protein
MNCDGQLVPALDERKDPLQVESLSVELGVVIDVAYHGPDDECVVISGVLLIVVFG